MKKLYPLATLLLSSFILTSAAKAQTYSFTYTAIHDGNWTSPATWDLSGAPSPTCVNCHIIINSVVHLNTSTLLKSSSLLEVSGSGAQLIVDNSGASDWSTSNNVLVANDGSSPANTVKAVNGGVLDASSADHSFDGVFLVDMTSTPAVYARKVGAGPSTYTGTTVFDVTPFPGPTVLSGGGSLSGDGILPITLVNFDAVVSNGAVNLTWTTMMESNSDHFDIERSANGGAKWEVVGKVSAKGNSSLPTNYSFTDADPGAGTFEYRVHGYDLDSRPTLSVIKVIRTTLIASIGIFPNPAKDYLNVAIPATEMGVLHIRLIGQSGQQLAEKNVTGAGGTIQSFSVSNYPPGNYLIQVIASDGAKQVGKVLISRN
ncbi:MAG TPA: T9SS type A sorting domain-containing protein [Puia sp.]